MSSRHGYSESRSARAVYPQRDKSKVTIELPTHPRTGLLAIGFRKNGQPIWPVAGGSGEGDPPSNNEGGGEGGDPPSDPPEPPDPGDDIEKVKQHSRTWEKRAKDNKTELDNLKTKSQDQLNKIAEALGLKPAEATPEQLQKALQDAQNSTTKESKRANTAEVRLAVYLAASKIDGLDASTLIDSISFMAKANDLDPTASDFASKIEALVKERAPKDNGNNGNNSNNPYGSPGGRKPPTGDQNDPRKLADRIVGSGLRPL